MEYKGRKIMEFAKIGLQPILALATGMILAIVIPVGIAIIWIVKKKEPFTSVLAGAGTFLLFALLLEKPIQNVLIFPVQMGFTEHSLSRYINARPILLSVITALFAGVFEEVGRFVAYRTVLKNRTNRETSISHGIGHGGIEVVVILGLTYMTYLSYAFMINTGTFGMVVDQVRQQVPDQVDAIIKLAGQIAELNFTGVLPAFAERAFAVLYHIGASIIVFYAARDRKKRWLLLLAIIIHTLLDLVAALTLFKVIVISNIALEAIVFATGLLTFCGAYFFLYKKDS